MRSKDTASPPVFRKARPTAVANCGDSSSTRSSWTSFVKAGPSRHNFGWRRRSRHGSGSAARATARSHATRAGSSVMLAQSSRAATISTRTGRVPHPGRYLLAVVPRSAQSCPGECLLVAAARPRKARTSPPQASLLAAGPCRGSLPGSGSPTRVPPVGAARLAQSAPGRCRACSSSSRASRKWNRLRSLSA